MVYHKRIYFYLKLLFSATVEKGGNEWKQQWKRKKRDKIEAIETSKSRYHAF